MNTPILLYEALQERVRKLALMQKEPEKYAPIKTGIDVIDEMIHGGLPRDPFYFVLVGDKKAGKSTVELNLALNFCVNSGKPTVLYMLEESNMQVADRVLSRSSKRVSRSRIFQLNLTEEDFDDMNITVLDHKDVPFYVCDEIYDINLINKTTEALGIDQQVVDNLQLLTGGKGRDERTNLVYYSKEFMYARSRGVTSFVVSQENQQGGAFGSTQALMDANLVIGVKRVPIDPKDKKKGYMQNARLLNVMYSRYSPGDMNCTIFFDGNHSRILKVPEDTMPEDPNFIMFSDEHQPPEDIYE